jgi:hypothetical protein
MSYVYSGNQPGITKGRRADVAAEDFNTDKCGTYAGYHRHRRYGVPACAPCRVANADYTTALRNARKAAA